MVVLCSYPIPSYLSQELLTPIRAFNLMSNITDEDASLLWMNPGYGKPDSLIIWAVPVPPVPIRPSVPQELGNKLMIKFEINIAGLNNLVVSVC